MKGRVEIVADSDQVARLADKLQTALGDDLIAMVVQLSGGQLAVIPHPGIDPVFVFEALRIVNWTEAELLALRHAHG